MSLILNKLRVADSIMLPGTVNAVVATTANDRNLKLKGNSNSNIGIVGVGSDNAFGFQLHGDGSNSYGFLAAEWGAWDFRKLITGALYMNNNDSYYLNTTSTSALNILNVAGLTTLNGLNFGYGSDATFYTGTAFDSSKYLILQNNTDSYGRIGLAINAKTFNGANTPSSNDGWAIDTPRSGIRFRAWLTGDTDYQTKFTIQHLLANAQNANGDLGIFARGYSTSNPAFILTGAGNVGIGTTAPAQKFEISTTADYSLRIGNSAASGTYTYDIGRNGSNGYLYFYGNQSNYTGYIFTGANGERMRIKTDGNVGIGTTDPQHKLEVSGNTLVTKLFVNAANASYDLYNNGTSYLNSTVSINGSLYFQNYGQGIIGLYASTRYQGIFAMGDAYKLPADGTGVSNLYGLTWSHPNAGGVAAYLNTHGMLALENGTFLAAVSGSIKARDDMRAPIFYDLNDTGYYCNPNGASNFYDLNFGGKLAFRQLSTNTVYGPNIYWGITQPNGVKLYYDEEFEYSSNSIQVYNNNGGTAVTITRKNSSFLDGHTQVPNSTGYVLEIKHDPATSSGTTPYNGGWYFATNTGAGKAFLCVFKMKIPSGRNISFHSNSTGTNSAVSWITNVAGTGQYEDYAIIVNSGTASWSSTFFFAIDGAATLFYTYLASATVYELTNVNDKVIGGNLGIGIASPNYRLRIDSGSDEYSIAWNRTSSKIWAIGADSNGTYFSNRTDTVLPIYIANAGNIGIGTTSPGAKLEVNGGIRLQNNYNLYWGAATGDQSAGANTPLITAAQTLGFYIIPNGTTSGTTFRIAANGDVGISTGTGAPNAKLDVNGGVSTNGHIRNSWGEWSMNVAQYPNNYTTTPDYYGGLSFDTPGRKLFISNKNNDGGNIADPNGSIIFRTGSVPSERMWITYGGNVGIGTSTPSTKLEVYNSSNTGQAIKMNNPDPGASAYSAFQFGNNNSSNGAGMVLFGGGFTSSNLYRQDGMYIYTNRNGGITLAVETNNPIYFATNNTERMRIAAGGAVGIDETNPLAKLQITKNDGDNGSGPYNHYGLLVTSNSSQATMGVMVTADTYSNLNLGSTVSSVKRFWHISKRTSTDSHRLEYFYFDGSGFNSRIRFETGGNFQVVGGQVQDQYGDLRTLPENAKSAAYTLAASDTGRLINITTGGITVPASVFSIGQVVTIYNNSASNQTITQGASVTMYLSGTATTGNRTLAQRGVATVICVASNTFVISGSGLT